MQLEGTLLMRRRSVPLAAVLLATAGCLAESPGLSPPPTVDTGVEPETLDQNPRPARFDEVAWDAATFEP